MKSSTLSLCDLAGVPGLAKNKKMVCKKKVSDRVANALYNSQRYTMRIDDNTPKIDLSTLQNIIPNSNSKKNEDFYDLDLRVEMVFKGMEEQEGTLPPTMRNCSHGCQTINGMSCRCPQTQNGCIPHTHRTICR